MNYDQELRLASPTLDNIPDMYVVVHKRHMLFYARGIYYGFGLGEDRINIRLVPAGLLGEEVFEHEGHGGIEYFTKIVTAKSSEKIATEKPKKWGTWSRIETNKGGGATAAHKEESTMEYGERSIIKTPGTEGKISTGRVKHGRYFKERENILNTGLQDNPGWEGGIVEHKDRIVMNSTTGDVNGGYSPQTDQRFVSMPVDEVSGNEKLVIEGDGRNVHIEGSTHVQSRENLEHTLDTNPNAGDLIHKLEIMLNEIKRKNNHHIDKAHSTEHINEIESDSEMAEKTNLDIVVYTVDNKQKTFNLRSKKGLCVTLYKNSFIMAECSNAVGQIFKLEDAGAVVQSLKKKNRPRGRVSGSSEWDEVGKQKERSEESQNEDNLEVSNIEYDNDKRYDGSEVESTDGEHKHSETSRPKRSDNLKRRKKGNEDKYLGIGGRAGGQFGAVRSKPKYGNISLSNTSSLPQIPRNPVSNDRQKEYKSPKKSGTYILDKLEEVLTKNTF